MKLYLAFGTYNYEGGVILGVFSTEKMAQEALIDTEWKFKYKEILEIGLNIQTKVIV